MYQLKEHRRLNPRKPSRRTVATMLMDIPQVCFGWKNNYSIFPSTGPEHVNSTCLPVLRVHPWVAEFVLRPPSEAKCNRAFDRNDRHTCNSEEAVCVSPSKRCRSVREGREEEKDWISGRVALRHHWRRFGITRLLCRDSFPIWCVSKLG